MNGARAKNRTKMYLSLRPYDRTLNVTAEYFNYFCFEYLWAATFAPPDPNTMSRMYYEFLRYVVLLTVSSLCRMFTEGHPSGSIVFAVRRDNVLSYMRQSYLAWHPQDERVEQMFVVVVTETTKKINIALALCPDSMLRDLSQNMNRGPNMVWYHVRRVMSFLMCNSSAGDGIHKNWNIADHRHPGMGDADRPGWGI